MEKAEVIKIWDNGTVREMTKEERVKYEYLNKTETYPEKTLPYDELVNMLIRERYSESQEFSILRQRDEKPKEYQIYYDYCEECKERAKEMLGIKG